MNEPYEKPTDRPEFVVRKGYRVELRRTLAGRACKAGHFATTVSKITRDIFVDDVADSDRELVALVFRDYPGFSIDALTRLVT